MKDGYKGLLQLKHDYYGGSKVDNAFKSSQSYNRNSGNELSPRMKICPSLGQEIYFSCSQISIHWQFYGLNRSTPSSRPLLTTRSCSR